jgi:hypothetical protein
MDLSNNDLFLEAIFHAQHKIYGKTLKPLTLFHLLLLEKYAPNSLNGFCEPEELIKAAGICSCKDNNDFYKMGKGFFSYFSCFYKYEKQLAKWNIYLSDYFSLPESFSNKEDNNIKNNVFPFSLLMATKLIKETGYSFDYVFYTLSISQVFWLLSVLGYLETGETLILSDKEKEIQKLLNS